MHFLYTMHSPRGFCKHTSVIFLVYFLTSALAESKVSVAKHLHESQPNEELRGSGPPRCNKNSRVCWGALSLLFQPHRCGGKVEEVPRATVTSRPLVPLETGVGLHPSPLSKTRRAVNKEQPYLSTGELKSLAGFECPSSVLLRTAML